jgi:flagellar basal-body rod protein FlgB
LIEKIYAPLTVFRHFGGMSDSKLGLFTAFEQQLRHLSRRQAVVAQNIANADTPGYRARDVEKPTFANVLAQRENTSDSIATPQIELPTAFAKMGARAGGQGTSENRDNIETKPNGNTVSLESELSKQSDVQLNYALITNLYRKQMGLLRIALGKSRGN